MEVFRDTAIRATRVSAIFRPPSQAQLGCFEINKTVGMPESMGMTFPLARISAAFLGSMGFVKIQLPFYVRCGVRRPTHRASSCVCAVPCVRARQGLLGKPLLLVASMASMTEERPAATKIFAQDIAEPFRAEVGIASHDLRFVVNALYVFARGNQTEPPGTAAVAATAECFYNRMLCSSRATACSWPAVCSWSRCKPVDVLRCIVS